MVKRIAGICAAAAVMVLMVMMLASTEAYAAKDLELDRNFINLDNESPEEWSYFIYKKDTCTEDIKGVSVSSTGVVFVDDIFENRFSVQAIGLGDVKVTVTGTEGSSIDVDVHVGEQALENVMYNLCETYDMYYGDSIATVAAIPGAQYTLTIDGDTYTGTAPVEDTWRHEMEIPLKKMYNLGKFAELTVEKSGVVVDCPSVKVKSDTSVLKVKGSGKTFKVTLWNPHKGDVIKFKFSGRTYTKKITKTYERGTPTFKIKVKKKIKKNSKFTCSVLNKYKKTLDKESGKLYKGKWEDIYA